MLLDNYKDDGSIVKRWDHLDQKKQLGLNKNAQLWDA